MDTVRVSSTLPMRTRTAYTYTHWALACYFVTLLALFLGVFDATLGADCEGHTLSMFDLKRADYPRKDSGGYSILKVL